MTPPMGRTMIRAAIIQDTPEITKNMALADSMVVTAAFMKWPFDCIFLSIRTALPRAQPPQDPAQRAKLPGEIVKAECHAGHSREASTAFSEACTAFLRIMSRIGANAFEHFRRAALRSAPSSSRCQRPARRTLRCRRNGLKSVLFGNVSV
jgi:hypothetical protein